MRDLERAFIRLRILIAPAGKLCSAPASFISPLNKLEKSGFLACWAETLDHGTTMDDSADQTLFPNFTSQLV